MSFIFKWLRVDRPPGVALHPSKTLELSVPASEAFRRCKRGIEDVLGGIVRESDEARGRIEATFGLVNSERMTVTVEALDGARSRVIIESRRGAVAEQRKGSDYVRALAQYVEKD